MQKNKTLIVGAGRRIRNNFLPALACLTDRFDVAGIVSPTPSRRKPLAEQWNLNSYDRIADVGVDALDVVAISVPTGQNAAVLRELAAQSTDVTLIIDTPIAWNPKELRECSALLSRFKRIIVAEDYMNFPSFSLARTSANTLIGQPTAIVLNNTGFLYHGLALIRSFVDFARVSRTSRTMIASGDAVVNYTVGGLKASVVGPYRGASAGGLVVNGPRGAITEFANDMKTANKRYPKCLLHPIEENKVVTGFAIEAGSDSKSVMVPALAQMAAMDFPDKSRLNLERGCGLIEVFKSVNDFDNINNRYGYNNAFLDAFVSRLATRGVLPVDPFSAFGASILTGLKAYARLRDK